MRDLARLQADFQRAILEGDGAVLAEILDSEKERRDILLGVYRDAYRLRLVEAMSGDFALLHAHLGPDRFEAMARAYIEARPSRHASLRWFGQDLPDFLCRAEPYRAEPALAELAALEAALADAFDAPDGPSLAPADLAAVAPDCWRHLIFLPQAHARRLDLSTNAFAIWSALSEEEAGPPASRLREPERLLVWRQDETPMVRTLGPEEAMLWDEACAGIPFGTLCEMAATYADPDDAALRVAGYLQGWIAAGLLAGFRLDA